MPNKTKILIQPPGCWISSATTIWLSYWRKLTVSQMLEREDFHPSASTTRQAYSSARNDLSHQPRARSSVALENDAELGGTDQRFNLMGVTICSSISASLSRSF